MSDKPATNLYTALLAAQRAMGPLTKNAQNPHLKNKYADLSAVLDTIEQPLWDNGLIVLQQFQYDFVGDDRAVGGNPIPVLVTQIIHVESGERIESTVPLLAKDPTDPQKVGSTITYYRRYSLITLLGLSAEDDDGNAAAKSPQHDGRWGQQRRDDYSTNDGMMGGAPKNTDPGPTPRPQAQRPAPASAPPPAQAGEVAPRFTAPEFEAFIERAWTKVEDNARYADLVSHFQVMRQRMTDEQYDIAKAELPKLKQAIAERAAPAVAG